MIRRQILVLSLWLTTIISPYATLAAQGDITIAFGGLCPQIVLTAGPPYYLFPAGGHLDCASGGITYFRITDKVPYDPNTSDANRAQIVPSPLPPPTNNTDGSEDVLRFYNFKIYAVTPTPSGMPQGYQVTFFREHVVPNTSDGPGSLLPDRWFRTTTTGRIKRVINNWIRMGPGYVTHPVGSSETALGIAKTYTVTTTTCPGTVPDCGVTLSTSGKWPETSTPSTWLTGNRVLRVPLSFKFQNGNANPIDANSDWVLLDTGAKINDQTNADPGDQDECSEQYTHCPSCWDTIFSTFKWTKMSFRKAEPSQSAKLDMFAKVNWASLTQDMARGGGEYLTSLATLLEIPVEKQTDFFILAQDQYRAQAEEGMVKRVGMLSRLQEAIASRPTLFAGTMEPTP
jgi:Protein of unknown function (DUF3015)